MDVKTLREIQRKERMSPYLQELGRDFYRELEGYVREVHSKYLTESEEGEISKLSVALGELENIRAIISDIYETREKKIVSNALYYVRSEDEMGVENLTKEEEEMLRGIIEVLREKRASVLDRVIGERTSKTPPRRKLKEEVGEEAEVKAKPEAKEVEAEPVAKPGGEEGEKAKVIKATIRILKDLPSMVGVDGKVYGSFKREDITTLPEANARVLINQGAAEPVNFEEKA